MKNIIKFEWERMIRSKSFLLSIGIALFIVAADAHTLYEYFKDGYDVHTSVFIKWIGAYRGFDEAIYLFVLLPLITSFAYSWTVCYDRSSGYITQVISRTNRKKYFLAKYIVSFISGGIIFAASVIFHFLLISMFLPAQYPVAAVGTSFVSPFSFCSELYYSSPYIFLLVWTFTAFLWGGAMVCIAIGIGMITKRYSISVILPFLIFTVQRIISDFITLRYSILIHGKTVGLSWSDMLYAAPGTTNFASYVYTNIAIVIAVPTLVFAIRGRKYECL